MGCGYSVSTLTLRFGKGHLSLMLGPAAGGEGTNPFEWGALFPLLPRGWFLG